LLEDRFRMVLCFSKGGAIRVWAFSFKNTWHVTKAVRLLPSRKGWVFVMAWAHEAARE